MLGKPKFPFSLATIVILLYVLIRAAFFLALWDKTAVLTWDVFGYYLYLPGLLIHNDLSTLSFVPDILETYYGGADYYYATRPENGPRVLKYPIGLAVMYLPAFLFGHLGAWLFDYPMDGYSMPYHLTIAMYSILVVGIGLIYLRKILQRYVDDITIAITLAILVLGTNLFNYTAYDGPMPHGYLFTLFILILWLTIKWHEKPKISLAVCVGLLIGLATITRPVNLLVVLIPLLWQVYDKESLLLKWELIKQKWIHIVMLVLGMITVGSIQLIYWKVYSGNFLFYSYEDQGFSFLSPHITDGLFSYRKGWLMYTPIMMLSILGFIPFFRKNRKIFFSILIMSVIHTYIVFSWDIWWYGGAFGQRPMIDIYGLLAIPIAYLVVWVRKRKGWAIATFVFAFLCTDLNLIMTWQAHAPKGGMYTEATTGLYYWRIFGSTRAKQADRIFIDVREELSNPEDYEVQELFYQDMEDSPLPGGSKDFAKSGVQSFKMRGEITASPSYEIAVSELQLQEKDWIRVSAWIIFTDKEWAEWNQAKLRSRIWVPEKTFLQIEPRLQWLCDPWRWHYVSYEFSIKKKHLREGARLKIGATADLTSYPVWIDDLKVELLRKKEQ